jgi:hypothetical protein
VVAVEHVHGTVAGNLVFGWHDRTVGAKSAYPTAPAGCGVVSEHHRWSGGVRWTGNSDAIGESFARVPKPALLDVREWSVGEQRVRAEVMTYVRDVALANDGAT